MPCTESPCGRCGIPFLILYHGGGLIDSLPGVRKPDITRKCTRHGLTAFVHEPSKAGTGYRCRKCRVEAVTRKRQALKAKLVAHLGGACTACGYSECLDALHFHHIEGKDSDISALIGAYRAKKVWKEVDRCVLLCANCHAEHHYKVRRTGIEPVSQGFQPSA